jgi:hypothetical protein
VALHRTGRVQHGYLHWVMPALLLIMAAGVWLSGRDLTSQLPAARVRARSAAPALLECLLQPMLSLLLLAISAERIVTPLAAAPGTASRWRRCCR